MADNLTEGLTGYLRQVLMGLEDMLPARVVAYDESTNRVTLQPLVMLGTLDGQKVSRAQVANVPVFRYGAGGFFIRFPVKPGDFGWLKASDRDISLVMQAGGGEDWPNTERLHSFEDAMFFPDVLRSWSIDSKNKDAMVIQSLGGEVAIALHGNKLEIDAANTNWNGNVSLTGNLSVDGNADIAGDATVGGAVVATGVVTGLDVVAGAISLLTHKHDPITGLPIP